MPDSNNNRALRNKQLNGGKSNTAHSGNKWQKVDKNQEPYDSAPQAKKQKTNNVKRKVCVCSVFISVLSFFVNYIGNVVVVSYEHFYSPVRY